MWGGGRLISSLQAWELAWWAGSLPLNPLVQVLQEEIENSVCCGAEIAACRRGVWTETIIVLSHRLTASGVGCGKDSGVNLDQ